jgi:hypothetical protein
MDSPAVCQILKVCMTADEYIPIPMAFRILIQWCEHDRQYRFDIVANQVAEVLIVPKVQRTFGDLAVRVNTILVRVVRTPLTWKWGLATDFAS